MKKILPCLLLSALLPVATLAQGVPERLLDIYALAKDNDHQLRASHAQYLADSEAQNIHIAALRPQVSANADFTHTDSDRSGTSALETDTNNTNYRLSLNQSLFDAPAWQTYQQGKVTSKAASMTYQAEKQALMVRTATAYFDTLRQLDQLRTDTAEEEAQRALLTQARQRYEVGLVSINEVYEAQAAYDNATASRLNTQANVGIALDALTVLTGQPHQAIASLKADFTVVAPLPNDAQAWVDFALANNLTLKAQGLSADARRLAAKAQKSRYLPKITGSISYTDSHSDSRIAGAGDSINDSRDLSLGVQLSMPIYTSGQLSAQMRQAEQQAVQAKERFLFQQRDTIQQTRALFLSITTNIAQISARKQAIISSDSALAATRAGYEAGTRNIVDVVNAQSLRFQAERQYRDTLYNYIIHTLRLKQMAGTLSLDDLSALDAALVID